MGDTDTGADAGTDGDARLAPEAAFSLLGNETRVAVLRALWDAPDDRATFSALREAVGMTDTGQFNYHLGKLVGTFVRKVDGEYELTFAGSQVIGAVLSGTYTETGNIEPVDIDDPCRRCGGRLRAHYRDERVHIACADCELSVTEFGVPPGILDGREREDLPFVFSRWILSLYGQVLAGFCPACTGPMRASIGSEIDEQTGILGVEHRCARCDETVSSTIGTAFIDHPAVVRFHDEHGIDLRTTPIWRLDWLFTDHATVVSEDPYRVRVTATIGDDALSLLVDDELSVVEMDG